MARLFRLPQAKWNTSRWPLNATPRHTRCVQRLARNAATMKLARSSPFRSSFRASMVHVLELIATLAATLFAGAALYINVAEHPARMTLETRMAALHWAPSYKRATLLQAPLALLSFVSGTAAWL